MEVNLLKTVSLELAKQLQEAGIEIETEHKNVSGYGEVTPMPTTDELLEWLPKIIGSHQLEIMWDQFNNAWDFNYWLDEDCLAPEIIHSETAEGLGKLALWVKEQESK